MISKAEVLAAVGSRLMRLVISSLRIRVIDRAGITDTSSPQPDICAFWHNRLFVMPYVFERYFSGRTGAALTSASKDGDLVAAFLQCFGIQAIRGSSSRRGAAALIEMKRATDQGWLVGITPDGPRGPRYHLNPGLVRLAQLTGGAVLPIDVTYSSFWRLKSWDGFMIPKPFSQVEITFDVLHHVPSTPNAELFEQERLRLERMLRGE